MVIDTNIIIGLLNAEPAVVVPMSELKLGQRALFISPVVITEVLALPTLTPGNLAKAKELLDSFIAISYDEEIAEIAALIRRRYDLKLPDAAIAATALKLDVPLVTRDRQFRKIKELNVVEL